MVYPFFDPSCIPKPQERFVAWLDLMGTQNLMTRSLKVVSSAIFKLHVSVLDAIKHNSSQGIHTFPVMDGVYITTSSADQMKHLLIHVLKGLCSVFEKDENSPEYQFLVRASVAKGLLYHGEDLQQGAARRLDEAPHYKASILIGLPVVNAYLTEKFAPPFGVAIHETAEADFGLSRGETRWLWFGDSDFDANGFYLKLQSYFAWCRSNGKGYNEERIIVHNTLARAYFANN
jgi:hypothetical protein